MIRNLLHDVDPYIGLDDSSYHMHAFSTEEMGHFISDLVRRTKPKLAVEVGSWLGWSAIQTASSMEEESELLCIDTWLGAREFWATGQDTEGWWLDFDIDPQIFKNNHYKNLRLINGYPNVYYTFLANIKNKGLDKIVTPFPQTSLIAGRWLKSHNIKADLIYIDGSHDYEDVKSDLNLYWDVLKPGGTMYGDDFWIKDVREAVVEFAVQKGLELSEVEKPFWLFQK